MVDYIFGVMDAKPSDFLNSFEKTIKDAAKKFKVREPELMKYFEREMLGEYQCAVSAVTLKDTDYETVVKVTTTGTNSNAASIVDASALEGADSNPRLSIVACQWTTGSQTNILFDAIIK